MTAGGVQSGGWTCATCGTFVPYGSMHFCGVTPLQPSYPPTFQPIPPAPVSGWRCPSCGAGNAPWVARCACTPIPPTPSEASDGTTEFSVRAPSPGPATPRSEGRG
jgi:hypothetical protein